MATRKLRLTPIGAVEATNGRFRLKIDNPYREGLQALDGFSHVQVLWWADQVDTEEMRKTLDAGKPYKKAPEHTGIFATRSPVRPNPIAITAVPVLAIDHTEGTIDVAFVDADNGTPILDLKPYHPAVDRIREVSTPAWCAHWPKWYEESSDFDWQNEFTF